MQTFHKKHHHKFEGEIWPYLKNVKRSILTEEEENDMNYIIKKQLSKLEEKN